MSITSEMLSYSAFVYVDTAPEGVMISSTLVGNVIDEAAEWIRKVKLPGGGVPSEFDSASTHACTWTTAGLLWACWCSGIGFDESFMRKALAWVLDNRNTDRGIPHLRHGDISIIDATAQTAISCALAFHDTEDPFYKNELRTCIVWLMDHQWESGGWSWGAESGVNEKPSVASSVFAVNSLLAGKLYLGTDYDLQGAIETAVQWLKKIQNKDGGWGEYEGGKSKPAITGLVCSLFHEMGEGPEIPAALAFILASQQPDGSWKDNIDRPCGLSIERVGTPYCLRALADCGFTIDSREFRSGFSALMVSYQKGWFQYRDTTMSWPTRDALLALTSLGLRLGIPGCREIPRGMVQRQSKPVSRADLRTELMPKDLAEFKLDFYSEDKGQVIVTCSMAQLGDYRGKIVPPFSYNEILTIGKALELRNDFRPDRFSPQQIDLINRIIDTTQEGSSFGRAFAVQLGKLLYGALFVDHIQFAFQTIYNEARQSRKPLRLQLRFPEDASHLGLYPWELLHDGRRFLMAGGAVELTRYIAYPEPQVPFSLSKPLHILYACSRPAGLADTVNNQSEWNLVQNALAPYVNTGEAVLDYLEHATYDSLLDAIREKDYEILHLDGHGVFGRFCPRCRELNGPGHVVCKGCSLSLEKVTPSSFFVLEGSHNQPDLVDSAELQNLLIDSTIGLAYISACQTSLAAKESFFGGVGPGLIQAGVPAVLAMQCSISFDSAARFAQVFYKSIMKGQSVALAAAEGRKSLFRLDEWFIPTIWLRKP